MIETRLHQCVSSLTLNSSPFPTKTKLFNEPCFHPKKSIDYGLIAENSVFATRQTTPSHSAAIKY